MRALLFLAVVLLLAGGGVWAAADANRSVDADRSTRSSRAAPAETPTASKPRRQRRRRQIRRLRASKCPAGVMGCRTAAGRVLFVESVDPDGDGDLHVVLAVRSGVSGPGITAVDVAPELRPKRDPRVGDRLSAAGPVQRGSFGQAQIHALELHLRRR